MAKEIYRQKQRGKGVPGKFFPKKQKGPGVRYFRSFHEFETYMRERDLAKLGKVVKG